MISVLLWRTWKTQRQKSIYKRVLRNKAMSALTNCMTENDHVSDTWRGHRFGSLFQGFFLYTVRPYVGLGQWFPTGGVGRGTQIVFKNKIQTEFHHLGSRYIACPLHFLYFWEEADFILLVT